LDLLVLVQSNAALEFRCESELVLLVTPAAMFVSDQIQRHAHVEPLLFTLNGLHSDHTVLVLSNAVQEHRSANVLALLATHVDSHVLAQIPDLELVAPL